MLDEDVQARLGKRLRVMYEEMPKGAIPDELWDLLLLMERRGDLDAGLGAGSPLGAPRFPSPDGAVSSTR